MKYTQKDVCRLLNIKRETLRHYEKEGLIVPEIDPVNQYRMYDVDTVYLISECKRYQANEFSLAEIREMLREDRLEDYIARMEEKQKEFERKKEYYSRLAAFNAGYVTRLKQIPSTMNNPCITDEEAILFVKEREGTSLTLTMENIEANRAIRADLSGSFIMGFFPDENSEYCEWGFGRRVSEGSEAFTEGRLIPGGRALSCTVDIGDDMKISSSWADVLKEYAEARRISTGGTILMRQLVRVSGGGETHRYMEIVMPLSE
jgi:DNA-binding transcriptional MerR regulator